VIVCVIATALVLILGTLAGYALGRLPMRGKFPTLVILLMISVFPEVAVIAPLYLLMRNLHLLNSYPALIIPYTAFFLPFAIWILRNYFLGIPKEMEETGRIDGASPLRTVWTIVLPQALPGLFTAGIFTFTACWTEFLFALTFTLSPSIRTVPVAIALISASSAFPAWARRLAQRRGGRTGWVVSRQPWTSRHPRSSRRSVPSTRLTPIWSSSAPSRPWRRRNWSEPRAC